MLSTKAKPCLRWGEGLGGGEGREGWGGLTIFSVRTATPESSGCMTRAYSTEGGSLEMLDPKYLRLETGQFSNPSTLRYDGCY